MACAGAEKELKNIGPVGVCTLTQINSCECEDLYYSYSTNDVSVSEINEGSVGLERLVLQTMSKLANMVRFSCHQFW